MSLKACLCVCTFGGLVHSLIIPESEKLCHAKPSNVVLLMDVSVIEGPADMKQMKESVLQIEEVIPEGSVVSLVSVDGDTCRPVETFIKSETSRQAFKERLHLLNFSIDRPNAEYSKVEKTVKETFEATTRDGSANILFVLGRNGTVYDTSPSLKVMTYVIQVGGQATNWDILASDQQHLVSVTRLDTDKDELQAVICSDSQRVCAIDQHREPYSLSVVCVPCLTLGCKPGARTAFCKDACKYFQDPPSIPTTTEAAVPDNYNLAKTQDKPSSALEMKWVVVIVIGIVVLVVIISILYIYRNTIHKLIHRLNRWIKGAGIAGGYQEQNQVVIPPQSQQTTMDFSTQATEDPELGNTAILDQGAETGNESDHQQNITERSTMMDTPAVNETIVDVSQMNRAVLDEPRHNIH